MSSECVIKVSQLGKNYRIYARPVDRVREMFSPRGRKYHSEFAAIENLSFSVDKGETVGIIGPNGSGKSTLLEMICGTLTPTSGDVSVKGRVAALLELGAGFNPAFSGKENVYLNAALLGVSRAEIDERFDEIVEFSNIGEFINYPVSTYSSGMYVRLAFATAINTDPDILIVDEALAVGDIRFQRKCFRRFQEMQEAGKTILFVTHAVDLVQAHCSRAIYLRSGRIASVGEPKAVIQDYLEDLFGAAGESSIQSIEDSAGKRLSDIEDNGKEPGKSTDRSPPDAGITSMLVHDRELTTVAGQMAPNDCCTAQPTYNPNEYRWGDQRAVIFDYQLTNMAGQKKVVFDRQEKVRLCVHMFFAEALADLIYGFTLKTVDGRTVFGANTRERHIGAQDRVAGESTTVVFEFTCAVVPGQYFISLGIALDDAARDNVAVDRRYDLIHLPVIGELGDFGVADLDLTIAEGGCD
jgi:lipopolysaccharide transport system ATP-binding protein